VIEGILPRLEAGRVLRPAFLGVATTDSPQGLEVVEVTEKNSADQPTGARAAGIAKGDVILAIDGREVRTTRDLKRALATLSADDKLKVHVRRGETEMDLDVTLTER